MKLVCSTIWSFGRVISWWHQFMYCWWMNAAKRVVANWLVFSLSDEQMSKKVGGLQLGTGLIIVSSEEQPSTIPWQRKSLKDFIDYPQYPRYNYVRILGWFLWRMMAWRYSIVCPPRLFSTKSVAFPGNGARMDHVAWSVSGWVNSESSPKWHEISGSI